jgi:ATP-binding cassette subfamily C protein
VWTVWSAVEALPAFFSGRLIATATDQGFLRGDAPTGLAFLSLLGASILASAWGTRQAYSRLAAIVEPFRDELVRITVRSALRPPAAAGSAPDTAVVARLTQQVEIVREAYASILMVAQGFVVTSGSAIIGLLTLVPQAALLVVAPLVVAVVLFTSALGRMARIQRTSILADERISQSAATVCGSLRDVLACGGEQSIKSAIGARIADQATATSRLARFTAFRKLALAIGGWLPVALILLRAHWLTRHGVSTGAILGALTYVLEGVHPALQTFIRGVGNTGMWLFVTLRRIVEATEAGDRGEASPVRLIEGDHGVRLTNATFAYAAGAEPVIKGLDLVVAPGDHVAIVGPSGVGKSTLANLLGGLLQPQHGAVSYGPAAAAELDLRSLADYRVLIPQEAYVFTGTVRENLLYLREQASLEELNVAVQRLGAQSLVDRLGGYDATLKPVQLSAGERQLLTLVRAYVSRARLIILDEATCHLDPTAEARVEEAFARRDGTLIVVAHRISSALRARHVLLLDGVAPVMGTHDELLTCSALYRDLVGHWQSGSTPAATSSPIWPTGLRHRIRRRLRRSLT